MNKEVNQTSNIKVESAQAERPRSENSQKEKPRIGRAKIESQKSSAKKVVSSTKNTPRVRNSYNAKQNKLDKEQAKEIEETLGTARGEKQLRESFKPLHSISQEFKSKLETLDEEELMVVLSEVSDLLVHFAESSLSDNVEPIPEPDMTGNSYELFVPYTDPIEHLKREWGRWLMRFNNELQQDHLCQSQLRDRDPKLLKSMSNKAPKLGEKLTDYIPSEIQMNNIAIADLGINDLQEAKRLATIMSSRYHRHQKIYI